MLETEPVIVIGDGLEGGGSNVNTANGTDYDRLEAELPPADFCVAGSEVEGCDPIPDVEDDATTNTNFAETIGEGFQNPKGDFKHVCDGAFTNMSAGGALEEWKGIRAARGRFTNAYFDFDGSHLHILNDWIYNDERPAREINKRANHLLP